MAPAIDKTINDALKKLDDKYRKKTDEQEDRISRLEKSIGMTHHYDRSSSSSSDDDNDDRIPPRRPITQPEPEIETATKEKTNENHGELEKLDDITFERGANGQTKIVSRPKGPSSRRQNVSTPAAKAFISNVSDKQLSRRTGSATESAPIPALIKHTQSQEGPNVSTRRSTRLSGLEIPLVVLNDENPSPYGKAKLENVSSTTRKNPKRGLSDESDGSPVQRRRQRRRGEHFGR